MKNDDNASKKRLYILVFICSTVIFAAFAAFRDHQAAHAVNDRVCSMISRLINDKLTPYIIAVSNVGEWYVYVPIALALCILPKTRAPVGIPVAVALSASALCNTGLKLLFAEPRPDVNRLIVTSGFSFPSGHAMNGTVFAGLIVVLSAARFSKRGVRILVIAAAAIYALIMGFSRVYLGVHYPTDVFAGYAAGVAFISLALILLFPFRDGP